ncbi:hypothetical protein QAD02_000413 [Eretmocerus hayati]|uniref:Uncharacterized protein n=1 Tax=Eretmocerus hayati TaxID=131215 RepID=A0ACC2NFP1_9HYME|nr:hypothetical protein QAD02_000413 [Eretmocerus hayati]
MDPNKPFCVFCGEKQKKSCENLTLFDEKSLERCRAIDQIRRETTSDYQHVQLPQSVNKVECYHSKPCYQKYTAMTASQRPLLKQLLSAGNAEESVRASTSAKHEQPPTDNPVETNDTDSTTDDCNEIEPRETIDGQDSTAANRPRNDCADNTVVSAEQSSSTPELSHSDCLSALTRYGSFGVSPLGISTYEPRERDSDSPHPPFSVFRSNQTNQTSRESVVGGAQSADVIDNRDEDHPMESSDESRESPECLFCRQSRLRIGPKTRRKELFLLFMESREARNRLIADATELDDKWLLEKITEYIGTNRRICYHDKCRKEYGHLCEKKTSEEIGETEWHKIRTIKGRASLTICTYDEHHVIGSKQVIFLQTLKDEYLQMIKSEHYNNEKSPTRFSVRYLEDKLKQHFGRKIEITLLNNKKIVKPANAIVINPEDMDDFYKRNSRHAVALALRKDILNIEKKPLPSDLQVADLIRGECTVPPDLLDFFKVLLNAPVDPAKSPTKAIASESMSYDAIHNVTKGRIKTPKHITLGMTIKSLTNSKKVITILNKEGHIASHTALCELETEATYASKNRDEVLPGGFIRHPDLNPKLVWDDYERYYDSRGKESIVRSTVGIAIQIDVDSLPNVEMLQQLLTENTQIDSNAPSPSLLPQPGPSDSSAPAGAPVLSDDCGPPPSKLRRSYESNTPDLPNVSGKPTVVQTLLPLNHHYRQVNIENVNRARKIDFAFALTHYRELPNTPMFFGYNALIHHDPSPKQKIFYLTTMNHSPTDKSVVLETMIRTAKGADESNATYIESTYDLGIAKIVFQLQSSQIRLNPTLRKNFHHIGTFHIKLNYQVALGKYVNECGLATILIDAELMGTNSAYSFVSGKNYSREWVKDKYAGILGTRKIIIINSEICIEFAAVGGKVQRTILSHLSCPDHEEADTKLVFHACQAPPSSSVTIRCSDTDVLIIMLGNMRHLNNGVRVWFDFGTGDARKAINVNDLRASLGDICDALPGIHAFTGNDYNPCFYGIGKTKPFNILTNITQNDPKYMHAFTSLGDDEIPHGLEKIIGDFTCHLYSVNNKVLPNVDAVRFAMFQRAYKSEQIEENFLKIKYKFDQARLPPCQTEFTQHFLRSAYICNLWRHAHQTQPTARDPEDFGWFEEDGKYSIKWFEGNQIPKDVLTVLNKVRDTENALNEGVVNDDLPNQETANTGVPNQETADEDAPNQETADKNAPNQETADKAVAGKC